MSRRREKDLVLAGAVPLEPRRDEDSPYAMGVAAAARGDSDDVVRRLMETAAADQDARGSYSLATWYYYGAYGYPLDQAKAVEMLRHAARHGIREAMFNLGVSYELGEGIKKNRRLAFTWYLRAGLRGDPDAIRTIANCYASGFGVPSDPRSAAAWYEWAELLGVDQGDAAEYREWLKRHRK